MIEGRIDKEFWGLLQIFKISSFQTESVDGRDNLSKLKELIPLINTIKQHLSLIHMMIENKQKKIL